jgi:hypothetical protein
MSLLSRFPDTAQCCSGGVKHPIVEPIACAIEIITEMVANPGGAERKDRQVGTALALHLELASGDRFTNLVVDDFRARRGLARLARVALLASASPNFL